MSRIEVFADHDCLVPLGFQCKQTQQIVEWVRQVSAIDRRAALRYQPEPRQTHRMVDAHTTCVTQCRAHCCEERREATIDQGTRRKPGQSPVLAIRIELIGWGTD